ncbi:chemotaxis protein CheW [Roseofilum sp. Belize Diploria]|uniref:chemotaxis protein CheW n=1 Tax=Roseofilum sp. Belize Diploria TaxID=2821501 RepID=UPI001B1B1988|nr:chemotaxis protein CheW [Roseofilum sp. Belize Diploria]MBP0010170.1 chemotaxis protein CheW [Roseofilum sp. Belize Diploria]
MKKKPFITFSLNGSRYGIEALYVEEIFFLPELTPVTEVAPNIAGVLNLRGKIIPVMDLESRLGYETQEYQVSDSVIVLHSEDILMGIIVNQVHEVQIIEESEISTQFSQGRSKHTLKKSLHWPSMTPCMRGLVQVENHIIMILNIETLLQPVETEELAGIDPGIEEEEFISENEQFHAHSRTLFCPHASQKEREVFYSRAKNLRQSLAHEDIKGLMPIAVIGLNEEYFGIDLELVREFTPIERVTPIPCCPPHIVGNINLRGEIVTLVNIGFILHLNYNRVPLRAVVVATEDFVVGVVVDKVFDVIYLSKSQIKPIPTAVHVVDEEYLRGTVAYQEKMMGLLDLKKVLNHSELRVNEAS